MQHVPPQQSQTLGILGQEFAHFGCPHTLVTDNAMTFISDNFQEWCRKRGIAYLSGTSYHSVTNGTAEHSGTIIQAFNKKVSAKSQKLPCKNP